MIFDLKIEQVVVDVDPGQGDGGGGQGSGEGDDDAALPAPGPTALQSGSSGRPLRRLLIWHCHQPAAAIINNSTSLAHCRGQTAG